MSSGPDKYVTMASAPPPLPPRKPNVVKNTPYYHANLQDLEDVKAVMLSYIEIEGAFLLRSSFTRVGMFTFSVVHQGSLKHFTLNVHDEKYYLIPQKKFYSLDDLVANYKAEDVPNLENVSGVRLKEPIPQVQRNVIRRHSESDNVLHTNSRKKTFQNPTKDYSISFDASELRNGVDSNHVSTSSNTMGKVPEIVNESVVSSPVDGRPAEAIPDVVPDHTEVAIGYTKVRNMDLDRTDTLMLQLRLEEAENLHTICDCGIYCRDAQLPFGWTVHISSQPDTRNRLFFVGPNQESSWDLPMDVVLELTQEQQNVLRDLRSGRYSVQHRPPRARGNSTSSQSKSEQ